MISRLYRATELQLGQHLGERPGRFVPDGLEVLDILQLLKAIQERLLYEMIHDDPTGTAELVERFLEPYVDACAYLDGRHWNSISIGIIKYIVV